MIRRGPKDWVLVALHDPTRSQGFSIHVCVCIYIYIWEFPKISGYLTLGFL